MTDTLPQRIEAAEGADRERTPESLTRLERAWLKRRECGWCNALMTARTCQAMFSEPCNMDLRRGRALQDYKPRAALRKRTGPMDNLDKLAKGLTDNGTLACWHNFILVTRTTSDIPVPYLKCSRCGEVKAHIERTIHE